MEDAEASLPCTYVHQETRVVYYLTYVVITSSTSIQPFIYLGFNLLYAFLYLLVVNQSILFDILNIFSLNSYGSWILFILHNNRIESTRETHINSFFHLGQPNKIRYLTKSDTFCEIQNSTRDTTILEHLL
jgi:hypothetical protein